jgi:hypothetical protein
MPTSTLTKNEADNLIKIRKIVSASVSWFPCINGSWRLDVKALAQEAHSFLIIKGCIGKDNYSFALLFNNTPIRKYTKHAMHKFQNQIIIEPHKHTWDEEFEDKKVYIPNDINPKDNINDQFLAFCKECNIELLGGYQSVLYEFKQ